MKDETKVAYYDAWRTACKMGISIREELELEVDDATLMTLAEKIGISMVIEESGSGRGGGRGGGGRKRSSPRSKNPLQWSCDWKNAPAKGESWENNILADRKFAESALRIIKNDALRGAIADYLADMDSSDDFSEFENEELEGKDGLPF